MQRHKHPLKKVYTFLRHISAPAQPAVTTNIAEPEMSINSPIVDALMVARCLPGDTDDQTLVDMYTVGASLQKGRKALCILPDEDTARITFILSRSGVDMTCIDSGQKIAYQPIYEFTIVCESLESWLERNGATALTNYGCLIIGQLDDTDDLTALKGFLFSYTVVIINGKRCAAQLKKLGWGKPDRMCGEFEIYDRPCRDWIYTKSSIRT